MITKETPSHASAQTASVVLTGNSSTELTGSELRRIKQALWAIMVVLLLFVAARLWCLEGLLFPIPIEGASMANTLVGDHYRVKCTDCGHVFRCDGERTPQSLEATCPNCGFAHNSLQPVDYHRGERVLIDRWVYLLGKPQRGDIVALVDPDDSQQRVVKRIIGLPGETIEIRRGDIFVNGERKPKDLTQLVQQATLVYDSRLPPRTSKKIPPRWQALQEDTYWDQRDQSFVYRSQSMPGKTQTDFDWLSFRNPRRTDQPQPQTEYLPVRDFDAYNTIGDRNLNDVPDVLLTCRAMIAKYGCLVFAAVDGGDRFEVHLCHDERKLKLKQNEHFIHEELLPHRQHDEPIDIHFALCDVRVLFGMDGRQVMAYPYEREMVGASQHEPQLQIGGAGARIRISNARVYRDLFYIPSRKDEATWSLGKPIPPNEYLLLGDNPPVSSDSRDWTKATRPRNEIIGRVIKPWWSAR